VLFNSFTFLAFFFVVVPLYYAARLEHRWMFLLAASLFFYATFRVEYVALLIGVTAVTYASGLALDRKRPRRILLWAGVVAVLLPLIALKYFDFLSASLAAWLGREASPLLPRLGLTAAAGLSFYTLSAVSYLVDVYRDERKAERHVGFLALYLAFFPKLLAGPIERFGSFIGQLRAPVRFDAFRVTSGLQQMLWGLVKKVVIADRLAVFVDATYRLPGFAAPADLVIATYFFAFQLYCDFSGYSDIAIGASRVLGFDLVENFRRPFLSTSVSEFWSTRWHLSLASWFRDYLYIPLGGNRVSRVRQAINVMAVFLISGLWHGANWTFVAWGGFNGLYQVIEVGLRRWEGRGRREPRERLRQEGQEGQEGQELGGRVGSAFKRMASATAQAALTFHLILVTWVFFRAESLADATTILSRIVSSLPILPSRIASRLSGGEMIGSLLLIAALLLIEAFDERRPLWERVRVQPVFVRWAVYYAMVFALLILGRWDVREFVYMQF
jgi:D-alanyl-lipoteichoic acid acyltransferase DltB (MBOAT superfamily)